MMSNAATRTLTLALTLAATLLTGCAGFSNTAAIPVVAQHLSGHVHGGQQPIAGASVQLHAAGTSGYGSAATPLLTTAVMTAADGTFDITGDYTCPSPTTQVYVTANGGNAGAGPNAATALMAALGDCGGLANLSYITINEVSTVGAAYALGHFTAPNGSDIGTSGTNVAGLRNAFLTVANLVSLGTGLARATTTSGNGIVPQRTLNTLADILAACVNTTGASSTPCSTLFTNAHAFNDPTPADTLASARNIALNPALNVAALFALAPASPPFQPVLAGQPNDWTVTIAHTGGGLSVPGLPAIDAIGNIWVPNASTTALSAFSPTGVPLASTGYTGGGLSQSIAVAVDLAGSIWVTNGGTGSLSSFNASGMPRSASGFLAGVGPFTTVAVGPGGDLVAAQGSNNTIYRIDSNGTLLATITGGALSGNFGVAVDPAGNIWATNHSAASVSKFTSTGTPLSASGYTGSGLFQPYQAAIDRNGSLWAADRFPSVSELTSSGTPVNSAGYAIAYDTESIAIDGDNTVWTANTNGSVTHLSTIGNALSPANGFQTGGAAGKGIALDASGNVWTTDTANTLYQIVGASAPITTPLAQAVKNNTLGTRP